MSDHDPLVSATWLKDNIGAPDIRVVDATWVPPFLVGRTPGAELYKQGHIPGAVFFDIDDIADRDSDLPHMLPSPIVFSSRMRKLGLGDGHRIIVYDQNSFFASARAWWMLRVMGHKDVYVLDGGFSAWQAVGGETEDLPPMPVERHFTARVRADLVRNREQVAASVADGSSKILDARGEGRFNGTAPEPRADLKSGHMPGAANVPASDLLTPAGTLKDADALHPLLADYLDATVITSCGSGVSAALINLALARLGHWDAALYDGSWSEWAAHADSPIATAS
ncbi:MAG: 3-mercaptopyruvate sulfurtransferase [Pseudomonadota bacterium]